MKVALIGLGRWGQVLLKELKLQAEVKYECDSKTGLDPVFADPEVQAIFIATPTETHFDIASKALGAGKHVFLEKPGTTSSTDLEKLLELAQSKNLKFAVGYEFTHHPAFKKLKELLVGKVITQVIMDWQKWGTFKDNAVRHVLCHEVSILEFLGLSDLTPLSHKKIKVISETDIIETEFKNVKSTINRVAPIKQKVLTILTEDEGYIWSNNELFAINMESQVLDKIDLPLGTPVTLEITDFLSAIKENREPQSNGSFALKIYKIIEQV